MRVIVWRAIGALVTFSALAACGGAKDKGAQLADRPNLVRQDFVDIMPPARAAGFKAMVPPVADQRLAAILRGDTTMWYDRAALIPGYQDSMGDPVGFRPNTIESILIDLAVPGGHARLFEDRGHFNFPFGHTGASDRAVGMSVVNFWSPPKDAANRVVPVAYWRSNNFSRYRWLFPFGTTLGELMITKLPNGQDRVFEIRTRTRYAAGWSVDLFRPFNTADRLATAITTKRPDGQSSVSLGRLVPYLRNRTRRPVRPQVKSIAPRRLSWRARSFTSRSSPASPKSGPGRMFGSTCWRSRPSTSILSRWGLPVSAGRRPTT